jgi:hypothetical protein
VETGPKAQIELALSSSQLKSFIKTFASKDLCSFLYNSCYYTLSEIPFSRGSVVIDIIFLRLGDSAKHLTAEASPTVSLILTKGSLTLISIPANSYLMSCKI